MSAMLSPKIRQTRRARSKSMVMGELSRSRPGSPCGQERALKSGWLKKQRSIMKNWQLRWFVLRTDTLHFYKDEEESKPQGFIPLLGSQVNEISANQEEAGRHLFEIVPGGPGEKERSALSGESVLLMANTQSDMEDWVRAIRRVIWAPFGGGIFGQRLEDTVQLERGLGVRAAPLMVQQCVGFIQQHGLQEEGLFRMPGQANLVKQLQDEFDCGQKPLFDSDTDVHTVASLLKLYLRELPEPVIPFHKYQDFLACAQLLLKDQEAGLSDLMKLVRTLPPANYNLLKYICQFLDEVQSYSSENKMSVQNLATVFGPNILRPKVEDPVSMMEGTSQVQHLMTVLISEHKRLYVGDEPSDPSNPSDPNDPDTPQQPKRGMVGWISEGEIQGCPPRAQTPPLPSGSSEGAGGSAPSMDPAAAAPRLGKPAPAVSPSRQAKALPSWKYSFKGGGVRNQPPKIGGSSVDVSSLPGSGGGNWLMNGLSSLRSHRRTSSGERVGKDSGLSPRLSTYDNVTGTSLSVPSVASVPWSVATSSCEISVVMDSMGSDPSGLDSGKAQWSDAGSGQGERSEVRRSSGEACASSAGRSENGLAGEVVTVTVETEEDGSKGLSALVTELKDELKKQKISYESRIRKLEESSADLRVQAERMEEELDQERKKYRMLEIKLRNSERGREDAENRNRLLQQEMEEFFSTLGELTLGNRTGK